VKVPTPPPVTVPRYLAAVQAMHGLRVPELARALHVTPSIVRRWQRGTLVPGIRRVRNMTTLWGGDADLLALGAALQRYARATGVSIEDAVRMVRLGRRTGPERKIPPRRSDRRQLSLPMTR
jgi:hypothetical protein